MEKDTDFCRILHVDKKKANLVKNLPFKEMTLGKVFELQKLSQSNCIHILR